jgi:antitoxin component YwqK of YwqJK toxin-antitoxin module
MKKILFFCFIINIGYNCLSQVNRVFIDDSNYVKKKSVLYYYDYDYELKDSLTNGIWILHNLTRNQKSFVNESNIIEVKNIQNGHINGTWIKYHPIRDTLCSKSYCSELSEVDHFKNGILNGISYTKGYSFCNYINGKKNGLGFTNSNFSSGVLYNQDTIVGVVSFIVNENMSFIESYTEGNPDGKEYKVYYFDKKQGLKTINTFKNGTLESIRIFYSGEVLKKEIIFFSDRYFRFNGDVGCIDFAKSGHFGILIHNKYKPKPMLDDYYYPCDGIVRVYDYSGILLAEIKYKNGMLDVEK